MDDDKSTPELEDLGIQSGPLGDMQAYRLNPGRHVECDMCSKVFTNSDESGGFYGMGTKGIGPCCADRIEKEAEKYGELHMIKQRCPDGVSFADWIRDHIR